MQDVNHSWLVSDAEKPIQTIVKIIITRFLYTTLSTGVSKHVIIIHFQTGFWSFDLWDPYFMLCFKTEAYCWHMKKSFSSSMDLLCTYTISYYVRTRQERYLLLMWRQYASVLFTRCIQQQLQKKKWDKPPSKYHIYFIHAFCKVKSVSVIVIIEPETQKE